MVSVNWQRPMAGLDKLRLRIILSAVYGLLSAANLTMMITKPTLWQGVFAMVLLVAALWLWFDSTPRTLS